MSVPSADDKLRQQSQEELQRIAKISYDIRQAIRNALPAPAEQFFTVMVPGTVLNFSDYDAGYDSAGNLTTPLPPTSVQLNEAILCDDMPALAGVQLGPTGRSVARSYAATLSKLTPAGSTVGIDTVADGNLSVEEARYEKAMAWLIAEDPDNPGKKRVDVYVEKQQAYTSAVEKKTKAFDDALTKATSDPRNATLSQQRAAYDQWVQENQRTYRNLVQAAYMDWVVVGKKEEVEYWFAIVDNDSAMSRVEASKESMRAAIVSDTDGAAEYNTVQLTPSNWAWLAMQKATGGPAPIVDADGKTAEWYTFEISRLEKTNRMLTAILALPPTFKDNNNQDVTVPPLDTGNQDTDKQVDTFLAARATFQNLSKEGNADDQNVQNAYTDMINARDDLAKAFAADDQANISRLNDEAQQDQNALLSDTTSIQNQITNNITTITKYDTARAALMKTRAGDPTVSLGQDMGIPGITPDPVTTGPPPVPDYWTSISVDTSSSYDASQMSASNNSFSAGASVNWGLWSVGGSAAHTDATSDAAKQMANSSVKVSFDCMRVNVGRSWLRPELFYDDDLKPTAGTFISPGPVRLATLMDPDSYESSVSVGDQAAREQELSRYSLFPLYPTAFLLAANVVLEVEGATADIQSHFRTSSTSGSATIGYGPFNLNASFSTSNTQASSTCETTATGCRITIKAPQIIGWISEMVPALPRTSA